MKDSRKLFQSLGPIGIGLRAACCLLPIIAVMFGKEQWQFYGDFWMDCYGSDGIVTCHFRNILLQKQKGTGM